MAPLVEHAQLQMGLGDAVYDVLADAAAIIEHAQRRLHAMIKPLVRVGHHVEIHASESVRLVPISTYQLALRRQRVGANSESPWLQDVQRAGLYLTTEMADRPAAQAAAKSHRETANIPADFRTF